MIKAVKLKFSLTTNCLIDSDVVINWLTKEVDPASNIPLWEAPHKIIKLIEDKKMVGFVTLMNILEIRFVLRRKKGINERRVNEDIAQILKLFKVVIPDEINLLKANQLQMDLPLSPFDAVFIASGLSLGEVTLLTRDKGLLLTASNFLPAATPEEFLQSNKF